MKVGIIGGFGGMGSLFARLFEGAGYEVCCSGRDTQPSNADIAASCDWIVVSVPIRETVRVIREIGPILTSSQLLCDLTSIKTDAMQAMSETKAQVIGLHPMFGPTLSTIAGHTIIASPLRCESSVKEQLYSVFTGRGASIVEMDPVAHDRAMAVVQGLVHSVTLAAADTIRQSGCTLPEILAVMSPVYRIEMGIIGRILGQSHSLYGDILAMNPAVLPVLDSLKGSVSCLEEIVASDDQEAFRRFFETLRAWFAEYIQQATAETDRLMSVLAEREP